MKGTSNLIININKDYFFGTLKNKYKDIRDDVKYYKINNYIITRDTKKRQIIKMSRDALIFIKASSLWESFIDMNDYSITMDNLSNDFSISVFDDNGVCMWELTDESADFYLKNNLLKIIDELKKRICE